MKVIVAVFDQAIIRVDLLESNILSAFIFTRKIGRDLTQSYDILIPYTNRNVKRAK